MNADQEAYLLESELTEVILGAFFSVYNELGAGFAESVYESALAVEMELRRIPFIRQPELHVAYRGQVVGEFRPDFCCRGPSDRRNKSCFHACVSA